MKIVFSGKVKDLIKYLKELERIEEMHKCWFTNEPATLVVGFNGQSTNDDRNI